MIQYQNHLIQQRKLFKTILIKQIHIDQLIIYLYLANQYFLLKLKSSYNQSHKIIPLLVHLLEIPINQIQKILTIDLNQKNFQKTQDLIYSQIDQKTHIDPNQIHITNQTHDIHPQHNETSIHLIQLLT